MKTVYKSIFALLFFTAFALPVVAADGESPREICASNAKAEGVPAEELADYIQSCVEDMSAANEGSAAESESSEKTAE